MDDISAIFRISGPDIERTRLSVSRSGMYVGRVAGNDLVLKDPQISRRHMRLLWQDGAFWVEDLGSSNGVWLNGARIEPHILRTISPGDVLKAGPYTLIYEQLIEPNSGAKPSTDGYPPPPLATPPPTLAEVVPVHPRFVGTEPPPSPLEAFLPKVKFRESRFPDGIPQDQSNWLRYLPAIYSDPQRDGTLFTGRFLLIFESLFNPVVWMVDNFDLYLSPDIAPSEWLRWMASWFDLLLIPELPLERQRAIMRQLGWLFLRRGTRLGLERLLELYFDVRPEIMENVEGPCTFHVRLPLSQSENTVLGYDVAERLIASQKPAFTLFTLEVT
ncbi:MAG: FHA domain-containing protein [Chloroflexi bacterium]|nr:FHA domain-containing protein [Chloroflexota bacterium]